MPKEKPYQQRRDTLSSLIRREKDYLPPTRNLPKASGARSAMVLDTPARETEGVEMGNALKEQSVPESLMDKITKEGGPE